MTHGAHALARVSGTAMCLPSSQYSNILRRPTTKLRYFGTSAAWGFACYLASTDRYEDTVLPTRSFTGTAEETLDCACELYLMALDF